MSIIHVARPVAGTLHGAVHAMQHDGDGPICGERKEGARYTVTRAKINCPRCLALLASGEDHG